MPGHGEKLARRREAAIAALLSEPTVEAAAKKAKVSYRTLKGWLAEADFQREFKAARQALFDDALLQLQRMATQATLALYRNLTCGKPTVEVQAAGSILDRGLRLTEVLDLSERLAIVEQRLAAKGR